MWPANSPDLNPLDFYFWSAVEKQMNGKRFKTRDELIIGIQEAINKVPLHEIQNACNSFMRRCRQVETANGQYILK